MRRQHHHIGGIIHFDEGKANTLWQGESFARSYLVRRGLVDD